MYSANQFRQLFQNKFNLQEWTKFLISYFGAQTIRKTPELLDIAPEEGKGYYLGQKKTTDNYEIGLFYLKLNSSVKKRRVGLRELIRPYLRYLVDAALVVFDDGDNWRLSFICEFFFLFGDPTIKVFIKPFYPVIVICVNWGFFFVFIQSREVYFF